MITAGDVQRWVEEAAPALRGSYVHRIWRTEETWVLLTRHHEGGDPEARAIRRVALEVALDGDWARCVAVSPDAVDADDKRSKKVQARDSHPFLSLLRKTLAGGRIDDLTWVENDRVAQVRCDRWDEEDEVLRRNLLSVELIGRTGNLILSRLDDTGTPRVLGSLNAGRANRPFEPGEPYLLPPPRPAGSIAQPSLATDVAVDSDTLALGHAVSEAQRAEFEAACANSRHLQLAKATRKGIKRKAGVLKKLDTQLAECAQANDYERRGDLLKANLQQVPRGASQVTLTDFTSGEPVEVELKLDPTKSVQDQMKALYKRARKLRSGEASILTRQGETDSQLEELRVLLVRLEGVAPEDDESLDAIEEALRTHGLLPKNKARPKQQVNLGPRSFRTLEGHEVLVGRSDEENDRLTMRTARGRDLFFHVSGCPGSHVILRVDPKRPPNYESIQDAATLAVYYSKARQRGAVDVSYTPRKWVRKPKGAKPGLVRISNQKTVRAHNDGDRIKRLLATARREEE